MEGQHTTEHRFRNLLEGYLADTATEPEISELFDIIYSGTYRQNILARMDQFFAEDQGTDELGLERANRILSHILESDQRKPTVRKNRNDNTVVMTSWRWAAAAAVFIFFVLGIGWLAQNISTPALRLAQAPKPTSGLYKDKQFIHLPDGSTALLNDNSVLEFKSSFNDSLREVYLTGEAFFDIAHNPGKPFKVITGKVTTTVLGTAFNVKAYEGMPEVLVTVTRGKVRVSNEDKLLGVITPDQQIVVDKTTNVFKQVEGQAEAATEWKSTYMILDNVSLETAAAIIEDKYNTKILFANEDLRQCRITATFLNDESIRQVLEVMSGVIQARYTIQPDGNVLLDGAGCK